MNIYRGCNHGCIYCDSRSKCYQMNHEFTAIEVKTNSYLILDQQLSKKRKPTMIFSSSMSAPYCIVEKELLNMRRCLEVINKCNCGVTILTKSTLLFRDLDLIKKINSKSKVIIQVTLTTASDTLCRKIEPNVAVTSKRVEMLKILHDEKIKTIVWLTPILPFINDTKDNLIKMLDYCSYAKVYGIIFFDFGLTLREENREYFYEQLDKEFSGIKELYIKEFKDNYFVSSKNAKCLYNILKMECKKRNIILDNEKLFEEMHTYESKNTLF